MDNINNLPEELIEHIFDYLNIQDTKKAKVVCTLWYKILHGIRFLRKCKLSLGRMFDDDLGEWEKNIIRSYRNISIMQCDDQENRLAELLFESEWDLESLELFSSFESCRMVFGNRLPQIVNLRELSLMFEECHNTEPNSNTWELRHDRIEKLRLKNPCVSLPLKPILPNLTSLQLQSNCRAAYQIIESYCRQLQYLQVSFDNAEVMDDMVSLNFPALEHLDAQLFQYDDKEMQLRYARTRNKLVEEEKDEQFVKSMVKLKNLELGSNLMLFRMGTWLSKYANQLVELSLVYLQIDQEQIEVVETMSIKILKIAYCRILTQFQTLPKVNFPSLTRLILIGNTSDIVFDKGLSELKSLKLSIGSQSNHKVLHKICNNLLNLEHLEIMLQRKLVNTSLRYLGKLTKLKSLAFYNYKPNAILWKHCPVVPSLRRITIHESFLKIPTIQHLAKPFPGLSELFLEWCYIEQQGEECNTERFEIISCMESNQRSLCHQQLKSFFPQCTISMR
ncbi:uncharacterized protein LOC131435190 [Malaya genurostris]|uniref:uncharacterized protein LOC131435190 n=1 Tax=Malaya genurostris TaxID=325434 RepID=UPI0026F3A15A|nr:uncharacterized protein LOC131435190 [Malaya genurostris]